MPVEVTAPGASASNGVVFYIHGGGYSGGSGKGMTRFGAELSALTKCVVVLTESLGFVLSFCILQNTIDTD